MKFFVTVFVALAVVICASAQDSSSSSSLSSSSSSSEDSSDSELSLSPELGGGPVDEPELGSGPILPPVYTAAFPPVVGPHVPIVRQRRFTCDLFSIQTSVVTPNHAACAAKCIAMGRAGGRCEEQECICREDKWVPW